MNGYLNIVSCHACNFLGYFSLFLRCHSFTGLHLKLLLLLKIWSSFHIIIDSLCLATRIQRWLYIMVQCWENVYATKVLPGEQNFIISLLKTRHDNLTWSKGIKSFLMNIAHLELSSLVYLPSMKILTFGEHVCNCCLAKYVWQYDYTQTMKLDYAYMRNGYECFHLAIGLLEVIMIFLSLWVLLEGFS